VSPGALRATFDEPRPFTVGLEEEVFLLDPETFELVERAPELVERLGGEGRFKLELPAAQIELNTSAGRQAPPATDAEIRAYVRSTLRSAVRSAPAPKGSPRQVLLFVHGYNSSHSYSVRKTAQLAGDLQLVDCAGQVRGLAVAYSWPSQDSLIGYLADEENAEWTQQRLVPFIEALSEVAREEGAQLQIMAHSMGCRAVVRALAQIPLMRGKNARSSIIASNVVLLAPDVSRPLFDQYFARFMPLIGHLTIYVSSRDRALAISGLIHRSHQRLGFLGTALELPGRLAGRLAGGLTNLVDDDDHRELGPSLGHAADPSKIDMIDVSSGLADPLGHSYEDPAFIRDLAEIIYHRTRAGTGGRANLESHALGHEVGVRGQHVRYFKLKSH
jgi:hypothetical protein